MAGNGGMDSTISDKAKRLGSGNLHHALGAFLILALLAWSGQAVHAQSDAAEDAAAVFDEPETGGVKLTTDEAARVLAQALPDEPDARYAALQRQFRAAQLLENRARLIETARLLVDAGRGRPGGEFWITAYLSAEFDWGSSGKALEASEPFVVDKSLSIGTRATVALRQTYFAAQGSDRAIIERLWTRADELAGEAVKQGSPPPRLELNRLEVRSEIERWRGEPAARVATLRQAVGLARRMAEVARARNANPRAPEVLDAVGWLDGAQGLLTYALVRQGRVQEAIEIARANLALWRAGQLSDGLGARWNYRLATALNSTQQYEAGLAAARLSDEMLQRIGAGAASHTRWYARQEMVSALIGLRRWKEADESYRQFLANMPPDLLARTRASDIRLLALLAAKNGRLEEALEMTERAHRFRTRLFGANHPQTQEIAGVRAVVRLLRGEISRAMSDYELLFAATLDNPGGWLDLELRGVRGYVFGIAFDEFMRYAADKALKGETVDIALSDRALQIADRTSLGVTQRALTDSTARVLAATPALRALIEQEQAQRRAVASLFGKLNGTLSQEDRLRREMQTDTFKALSEVERKGHAAELKTVREKIKAQQDETSAAGAILTAQRETIAKQFPAYADLVTPTMPRPEQLRRLLGSGEAMLVIYPMDTATLVWLIRADGRSGFSASKLTREELGARAAELRAMLNLGAASPASLPRLQPALLHALYRELLAPHESLLRELHSLLVTTNGPLASLPFATLVTKAPDADAAPAWLVRQMAVTQLPSPSALQALRRVAQPRAAEKALIGFGDPLFKLDAEISPAPTRGTNGKGPVVNGNAGADAIRYDAESGFAYTGMSPLPETRAELLAVAAALGADAGTDLVFGAQATRRAVLEANLLDRRVVAFATHGLMPGEFPGISKPALAMAANSDVRESPLLELDDVLGLRLNAQWVLLSACNTAAGEQGGAAMSGLVRGFFFAGARSVLATHWAVETTSAAALSTATFKAYAGGAVARSESLRAAQLAMIDGSLGAGRWSHPFYWAPYALFGDPSR
jgi:CHAT domain-containing protein/tetratricopeptide (TPR) repeat protein